MCAKFDIKRFNGQSIKGGEFKSVANAMDILTYFMAHSETKRIEIDVDRTEEEKRANGDAYLGYIMFTDDRYFVEVESEKKDPHVVIYHNAIGPVVRYFDSEDSARECIKRVAMTDSEATFELYKTESSLIGLGRE